MEPEIIARPDHIVTRKNISSAALKVLYGLKDAGYTAYLAGGGVRDLLLQRSPKDFDVATNATPEEVKRTFRNCRLIGRRFRLAHIYFHNELIEVATFRAPTSEEDSQKSTFQTENGVVVRDNVFGTAEEDALRRDFTVNALFYDIADFSIIDYAGGLKDLDKKIIRVIGDPETRFIEDPVRILRAVRFAASLDFTIEKSAAKAAREQAPRLEECSSSRLYEEILKLLNCGKSERVFELSQELKIFEHLFPEIGAWLNAPDGDKKTHWLQKTFQQIDRWRKAGIQIDPALDFALFFGEYHEWVAEQLMQREKLSHAEALVEATHRHIRQLCDRIRISKAVTARIASIMAAQPRFMNMRGKNVNRLLHHRDFPEAFVYFKFASRATGRHKKELIWWEEQRKNR
jgi:poly(A) polymerase